jgi:hypothetical protein
VLRSLFVIAWLRFLAERGQAAKPANLNVREIASPSLAMTFSTLV